MSIHLSVFPSILYVHISISSESFDFNHISLFIIIITSYREDNRNGIARKGYGAIAKKGARKGVDIDGMDGWVDMENQDLDDKKKKKTDDDDEEEEEED